MCTSFISKGNDIIYGFNFDADESLWNYKIYADNNIFYIGIKVGSTLYKVHGVNRNGNYACLPYMNQLNSGKYHRGKNVKRIDLLVGDFVSGKYDFAQVVGIVQDNSIVNPPNTSFHSHFCDKSGNILLVEAGIGYSVITQPYSIITNYSLISTPKDLTFIGYGADRWQKGNNLLVNNTKNFSVEDALHLLSATSQEGLWGTRVSFVYSCNDNAVYYCKQGDFSSISIHRF